MQIKRGDRVAFSRSFLQSIGCHSGWRPFARGTVVAVEQFPDWRAAQVAWDGHVFEARQRINVANLVVEHRIPLEPV